MLGITITIAGYPLPHPRGSFAEAEELMPSGEGEEGDTDASIKDNEAGEAGIEEEGEEEDGAEDEGKGDGAVEEGIEGEEAAAEGEEQADGRQSGVATGGKKRKLINQFNFCERAALTFTYPKRVSPLRVIFY